MNEIWEIIQQNIFWLIIVFVILLLMGLMYQLKMQVRRMVRNEIYDHFPTIKKKMEDYELSLHNLKLQVEECERRLKEPGRRL
jgi:type II secretory pathway component PulF